MSLSDPMGDMLTIIRNAKRQKKAQAEVKRSQLTSAVLNVLKKERYIYDFKVSDEMHQGKMKVYLKAPEGLEARRLKKLNDLQRVSKPGLRVYTSARRMPRVLNGLGASVISTSKGVMSGRDARRNRLGGEVLLKVW